MPRMIGRLSPVNIVLGFTLAFTHTPSINWVFQPQSFLPLLRRRVAETELGYRFVAMPPKLVMKSVSDKRKNYKFPCSHQTLFPDSHFLLHKYCLFIVNPHIYTVRICFCFAPKVRYSIVIRKNGSQLSAVSSQRLSEAGFTGFVRIFRIEEVGSCEVCKSR